MNSKYISIILFFALVTNLSAQKEMNNWYFGMGGGITFNTTPPTALTNGQLNQSEGCASISDKNGSLLFYTSGTKIYDASHVTMPNGLGLSGNTNSTQSGVIVPMPLSDSLYYVFTVKNWTTSGDGFAYNVVDMSLPGNGTLNSPLGDIVQGKKNILIHKDVREQVTAIYHSNCKDVWIITHQGSMWFTSDTFMVYLLTDTGLQMNPVKSALGMTYTGSNRFGSLKPSHDGKKLCSAFGGVGTTVVELYDFDNSSGVISNPIMIADDIWNAYSSEFSPDNNILYVTGHNNPFIYQYDLTSGVSTTIIASKTDISNGGAIKSSLQIGPDNKIYVSRKNSSYLGVINDPNVLGTSCNYVDLGVSLNGGTAQLGLPTFMQSYFPPTKFEEDTMLCFGDTLLLDASASNATYIWHDSSTTPVYTVTQSGVYSVEVSIYACVFYDTSNVSFVPLPNANAGPDTALCLGDTMLLGVPPISGSSYSWQATNSLSDINVSNPIANPLSDESFIVTEIDSNGCEDKDTVSIIVYPIPNLGLADSMTICKGDSIQIITQGAINYSWSPSNIFNNTGIASPLVYPDSSISLYVMFDDSATNCSGIDSLYFTVNYIDSIVVNASSDTICLGDTAYLYATGSDSCWWSSGLMSNVIQANPQITTQYIAWSNNVCGSDSDSIIVTVMVPPLADAGPNQTITYGESATLEGQGGITYLWSPSSDLDCPDCQITNASPMQTTLYTLVVTDSIGCVGYDSVLLELKYNDTLLVPNLFSPNGDGHNDILYVRTYGEFENIHFRLYNRWGKLVFETYDENIGWDGYYSGALQPLEVYVYYLTAKTLDGETIQQKGDITLMR